MQTKVGSTLENLHPDNAKEQDTKDLRPFLQDQGAEHTITVPHSSQQKSVVERFFRVIFSAARCALSTRKLSNDFWYFARLDAIDKGSFIALLRKGGKRKTPHEALEKKGITLEGLGGPHNVFPFGQHSSAVATRPKLKKIH